MKNPGIAFLLGALPLLQAGLGLLLEGEPSKSAAIAGILFIVLGFFGWGWGYVYLGHTLRAVGALSS